jgi:hypothetical protein
MKDTLETVKDVLLADHSISTHASVPYEVNHTKSLKIATKDIADGTTTA